VAGLAFVSGCGLSEYQAKYGEQQKRFDQEYQYLGSPLKLPESKDSNSPNLSVFILPPLGISSTPEDKPEGILYRYPKISSKLSPEPDQKVSEIESVYLAVETGKDWNEFKKRALKPFNVIDAQNARKVTLEVPGRPSRGFETISFTHGSDPSWSYQFYFFKDDVYRVTIGFRGTDKALASETSKQAMEFSVRTLAVGRSANR
jgi:hypothetical protein